MRLRLEEARRQNYLQHEPTLHTMVKGDINMKLNAEYIREVARNDYTELGEMFTASANAPTGTWNDKSSFIFVCGLVNFIIASLLHTLNKVSCTTFSEALL